MTPEAGTTQHVGLESPALASPKLSPIASDALAELRGKDKIFTYSNAISALRALLIIPAVLVIVAGQYSTAAAIFFFAFLTDLADGYVARKTGDISELGKVIDPLADKIFVGAVVITMMIEGLLPVWFISLIVARDLLIVLVGIWATRKFGLVLPSNYPGKLAVFTISLTLFMVMLGVSPSVLVFMEGLSVALMCVSLVMYATRLATLLRQLRAQ